MTYAVVNISIEFPLLLIMLTSQHEIQGHNRQNNAYSCLLQHNTEVIVM